MDEELRVNKKGPLFWKLTMVTLFAAYLIATLADEVPLKLVGWFSDRDAINDLCDHISADLIPVNATSMAANEEFHFVSGEAKSSSSAWFDEVVRVSDYVTGALSDFNFATQSSSAQKFHDVLRFYASGNNKTLLAYRYSFAGSEYTCSRTTFGDPLPTAHDSM